MTTESSATSDDRLEDAVAQLDVEQRANRVLGELDAVVTDDGLTVVELVEDEDGGWSGRRVSSPRHPAWKAGGRAGEASPGQS